MDWKRHTPRETAAQHYAREFHIQPLTAQVLLNRGVNGLEVMRRFLEPDLAALHDPFLMRGMETAVRRLRRAIVRNERIHLHGDYDVDGISATAILMLGLRAVGADVHYRVSNRSDAAVGLGMEALRRDHLPEKPAVIVTVDCGTSNGPAIEEAMRHGVDVIVVDHHLPGKHLPKCAALLNPQQPKCEFPFPHLAAVGVAYNLIMAIQRFNERDDRPWPRIPLEEYADIVALGTVADVVPLIDENRAFVHAGLRLIRAARRPGICALLRSARIISDDDESRDGPEVNSRTIGFRLAPLLNAAGRMGDASECVELLITESYRVADGIARELERQNEKRQSCEREIVELATARAQVLVDSGAQVVVLADAEWHPGVLGIVASRLMEKFHLPVVVAAVDGSGMAKGSVRSPDGVDMLQALGRCRDLLETYGGHRVAAGVSFAAAGRDALQDRLDGAVREQVPDGRVPEQVVQIDATVDLAQLDPSAVEELDRLGPFGAGNPEPVLEAIALHPSNARQVHGGGYRMRLRQGALTANAWAPGFCSRLAEGRGAVDVAFTPRIGRGPYGGSVEFVLRDVRESRRPA